MTESLSDLGEFGLIDRLRARLGAQPDVPIGPGDDAAMLSTSDRTLAAADMLVEGVHFDLAFGSAADAAYKAIAVNVSDISAMGGVARFALVTLAIPAETGLGTVDALFDGLLEGAAQHGVAIVGGDLSSASQIVLSVTVLGPAPERPVRRGGARAGDLLCVTGSLGAGAAGLALLRSGDADAAAVAQRFPDLLRAYRRPRPPVAAGPAAAGAGATAMIDVSDGLARDAAHIAEESGLGLIVRAADVPLAPGVAETAELLGVDAAMFAVGGGEDYELAIACPSERFERVAAAIEPVGLTPVGEFTESLDRLLDAAGERVPLDRLGWAHFA